MLLVIGLVMVLIGLWLMDYRPFIERNHAYDEFTGVLVNGKPDKQMKYYLRLMIGTFCLFGMGFNYNTISIVFFNIEMGFFNDV